MTNSPVDEPVSPTDSKDLRDALSTFATGVTILTTTDEAGCYVGVTVNSFSSVSLQPPLILWSLARNARSLPVFRRAGYFAVHVLGLHQKALSDRFARCGARKFAGLSLERGLGGVPLLADCAACFQCKTYSTYDCGDHVIFVGQVRDFRRADHPPLIFHGGTYAALPHGRAAMAQSAMAALGQRRGVTRKVTA